MVRPLYPLQNPRGKKKEAPPIQWWKSPHLMGAAALILLVVVLVIFHTSRLSRSMNPSDSPTAEKKSLFSFLSTSKSVNVNNPAVEKAEKEKLARMGISAESSALQQKITAKNFSEQRRMRAIQKYEAAKETSERRREQRNEVRKKLASPTSMQLKDAVLALEDSNNLGIMKLERMLDEHLHSTGGDSSDLEVLIFAYDNLAKAYEEKNMPEKAKEAYINAFTLMKKQAPASQGPEWDNEIQRVESLRCPDSRGN